MTYAELKKALYKYYSIENFYINQNSTPGIIQIAIKLNENAIMDKLLGLDMEKEISDLCPMGIRLDFIYIK